MDPNETLRYIRQVVVNMRSQGNLHDLADLGTALAEHVQALDEWLSRGGFLPGAWEVAPPREGLTTCPLAPLPHTIHPVRRGQYGYEAFPEPLGGPIPGVAGSHLPEGEH